MLTASTPSPFAHRNWNVGRMRVPAPGFPHQLLQSIVIAALECGARTCTGGAGEKFPPPVSRAGRTLPCQRMRTRGRPVGSEQALPLVFVSVTGPSIVPVAPFNPLIAESSDERQRGGAPMGEPLAVAA